MGPAGQGPWPGRAGLWRVALHPDPATASLGQGLVALGLLWEPGPWQVQMGLVGSAHFIVEMKQLNPSVAEFVDFFCPLFPIFFPSQLQLAPIKHRMA